MTITKYSHAFLVGSFNGNVSPKILENDKQWIKEVVSLNGEIKRYEGDKGYNGLCTLYYKAHLDAMLEAKDVKRPKFLQAVHHYIHNLENKEKEGREIMLPVLKGKYPNKTAFEYRFRLCKLHLYFFPLNFVLFAIEIDDSGTDLDDMTAAHSYLMGCWDSTAFDNLDLSKCMEPLTSYLSQEEPCRLTKDGNKLKIFQTIKIETNEIEDEVLYEIGTSSPIGCVKDEQRPDLKPAESYFKRIMDENTVATFDNWRGLALVDSFTMLGKADSFYENDCNYLYFPLIYLRCLFEKTFCFSRNNAYRENRAGKKLTWEIEQMEKYYFYDNISYNFQPSILYQTMAKALDIKEEREELTKQVKDSEEKRFDRILAGISIFAVISVIWDFCSIIKDAKGISESNPNPLYAQIFIIAGLVLICLLLYLIFRKRYANF